MCGTRVICSRCCQIGRRKLSGAGATAAGGSFAPLVLRVRESNDFQFWRVIAAVGNPAPQVAACPLRSASRLDGDHQMVGRAGVRAALEL